MASIIPRLRPQTPRRIAENWLKAAGVDFTDKVVLLSCRGFYLNSMGKPGVNDRGIYDDAFIVISPTTYQTFNANTDPSASYKHGVATLVPGVYKFRPGYHKYGQKTGHPAFRPATKDEELPVTRDGVLDPRPGVALNIHRGGETTTSSEGCQTVHPAQWKEFYALLMGELDKYNQKTFDYCLIVQQG